MNIRRRKSLGEWLFVMVFLAVAVLSATANFKDLPKAKADSCSVALTGSPFADIDAEDTHLASQWVVTEGGAGVYDSGRDTANLTTITISGASFLDSHTYDWKVRYQDQHFFWSDYSAESSFLYSCGSGPTATPTPTPAPTATPTPAPEGDTATPTPTVAPTVTSTATPPSEPCMYGVWTLVGENWICFDTTVMLAQVIEPNGNENYNSCSEMRIYYVANPGFIGWNSLLESMPSSTATVRKNKNWRHDIYLSTDGIRYQRIVKDFDYGGTWPWIEPGLSGDNHVSGPLFSLNYYIPANEAFVSGGAKILVHVYDYTLPIGVTNYDWGNTVIPFTADSQTHQAYDTSDDNFQINQGCPGSTSTPSPITDGESRTVISVISPHSGDIWEIGSSYQVLWTTKKYGENAPDVNKVNLLLSTDGGKSFGEPLAVSIDNNGVTEVTALKRYETDHAVIRVEPAESQPFVQSGLSDEFIISITGFGAGCGIICSIIRDPIILVNDILLLGALIASILPWIIILIISSPILARILETLFATDLMPLINTVGLFITNLPAILAHPFSFFYLWRRRQKWGVVYDSISKQPIPKAAVRLFSEPDERLREVQYTSAEGKFGFLVPSGKYTIVATKAGFSFPTHIIRGSSDGEYGNIYKGGELVISKSQVEGKSPLKINIPLDQAKTSYTDLTLVSFTRFIQEFFAFIRVPFMLFGVLLTIYIALKTGAWYYWVILGIYALLWIIEIKRLLLPRAYGLIQDETGRGVGLAVVRVLDQNGRLKATLISGNDGKFNSTLPSGRYFFIANRAGYLGRRSGLTQISKTKTLGRINLKIPRVSKVVSP